MLPGETAGSCATGWMFDFGASIRAFMTYLIQTSALASEEREPEWSDMKKDKTSLPDHSKGSSTIRMGP